MVSIGHVPPHVLERCPIQTKLAYTARRASLCRRHIRDKHGFVNRCARRLRNVRKKDRSVRHVTRIPISQQCPRIHAQTPASPDR
jgi:hypothetical protein